ncbi:MAG: hypothetical protein A3H96_22955 [Acidobacteria bacterium RIFCSPLOWO2_02_FULL_67_36]|nr:MAG: hypothetical protein A3H96_22955 [Acidobacteria bacterium RIFCSPLOWO2_02_FULL_67_36]OFW26390.1 MAG: hypothetical protein A3G21_27290 [Acidobacteria bacterium RIFCSPLOWO2_12_FULL_66_21]
MHSVGFIGGGRIARILIGGWARKGLGPVTVLVHEPDGAAFDALTGVAPRVQRASALEAAAAPVVFVALHPPAIAAALAALRPAIRPDTILVSLAPKITLAALSDRTGTSRVARMIPNAPSLLGLGYNPVTYGAGLDWHGRGALSALFSPWGDAPEVEESTLEAYALVTGMGPTYFWFQWQTLRELASEMGVAAADRDRALGAMIRGAVATLLDSGLSPSAVMDLVPVKPLADVEPGLRAAYREALPALHAKIQPAQQAASVSHP